MAGFRGLSAVTVTGGLEETVTPLGGASTMVELTVDMASEARQTEHCRGKRR